ncbi:hypothetical protein Q8A67_000798 [Cirrhinus molitorella]|uniref:Ig-like domain-containing protein n=1 Tax=Cirrhinus molitorella TaxID=172907 RepID=A0AA88QK23_9TELE|nr:hypothetical protein Q8A67_000798 [Cirrhinus molitorella]
MFTSYLLLLLAAVSYIDCQVVLTQSEQSVVVSPGGSYKLTCACSVECNIVLTQTNSIVLQPGDSLTLTCEVSGYSVTDNSYATAWIRHPAGKALEWIVHIWGGGDIYKEDSLANKFSISKSDSSKTVTLKGQNLQTEDTAVYYCTRLPSTS